MLLPPRLMLRRWVRLRGVRVMALSAIRGTLARDLAALRGFGRRGRRGGFNPPGGARRPGAVTELPRFTPRQREGLAGFFQLARFRGTRFPRGLP